MSSIHDTKEKMSEFYEKHAIARANKQKWVETSPEIMKMLMPNMQGKDYFGWHDVFVCEYGQSKVIEERESKPMIERMQPGDVGVKILSGNH